MCHATWWQMRVCWPFRSEFLMLTDIWYICVQAENLQWLVKYCIYWWHQKLVVSNIKQQSQKIKAIKPSGWSELTGFSDPLGLSRTSVFAVPMTQPKCSAAGIYSNSFAFAALKSDQSVVTWGLPTGGGDSRAVRREPKSLSGIWRA